MTTLMDIASLVPIREEKQKPPATRGEHYEYMNLQDMLDTVLGVQEQRKVLVWTFKGISDYFAPKDDVGEYQRVTAGIIESLRGMSALDDMVADAEAGSKSLIQKIAEWGVKKAFKTAIKIAFRSVLAIARWVIKEVVIQGLKGLVSWFIRPMLTEILGFVGLNPELWIPLAIVGGAGALAYFLWDKFTGTGSPMDVTTADKAERLVVPGSIGASDEVATTTVKGLLLPSAAVQGSIMNAARLTGVGAGFLLAEARQESTFNPAAGAGTSSAMGLFQFTKGTWANMVTKYGKQYGIGIDDRLDPDKSAIMGALFARDNADILTRKGLPTGPTELYTMHMMGSGDGPRLLSAYANNPGANAAAMFPGPASSNKTVFYHKDGTPKTVAEVYDFMAGQVGHRAAQYTRALQDQGAQTTVQGPNGVTTTPGQASPAPGSMMDADPQAQQGAQPSAVGVQPPVPKQIIRGRNGQLTAVAMH